eukprot:GHVT01043997.1.p2 GENE.GHVT01043997.1~~GHVT01043997.1.p2  ORF type:complete len:154 (+),score=45.57 GHVT01043997.1:384-845(+)
MMLMTDSSLRAAATDDATETSAALLPLYPELTVRVRLYGAVANASELLRWALGHTGQDGGAWTAPGEPRASQGAPARQSKLPKTFDDSPPPPPLTGATSAADAATPDGGVGAHCRQNLDAALRSGGALTFVDPTVVGRGRPQGGMLCNSNADD